MSRASEQQTVQSLDNELSVICDKKEHSIRRTSQITDLLKTVALLSCFAATVLLYFLILGTAQAEEVIKKGEILSLRRCVEIALRRQPNIVAATGGRMVAESKLRQARSSYYPQIEIGAGYSKSHTRDTLDNYSSNLFLRQNIYDFGRTETNVKVQRLNLESSEAELSDTIQRVVFDVTQSFYNLIKARRNRDVALEVVRQYEEHLVQAKGFYEAGIKPRYDVTQAEVNRSNARLNLIRAENAMRLAIASLNNSIGVPDAPEYEIEDNLSFRKIDVTFSDALSSALRNRSDLRSAISKRKAAEQSVELVKRDYYPILSGTMSYGWSGNNFPLERQWNLGATLTIPIFNGHLTKYRVEEAEANLNIARTREEAIKQNIYLEVQQAYLNLREAEERIPVAELAVRQATENLELARGRYEAGLSNPVEVTDAETSYVNAHAAYIQALTDYRIAIASLERVMGTGHEENSHR